MGALSAVIVALLALAGQGYAQGGTGTCWKLPERVEYGANSRQADISCLRRRFNFLLFQRRAIIRLNVDWKWNKQR